MEKTSYDKGLKDGYIKGVKAAEEILKKCEKDPKDITRLSLLVLKEIDALICD